MDNTFESLGNIESVVSYCFPSFENERGELLRTAEIFAPDDMDLFVARCIEIGEKTNLCILQEQDWKNLENTDSADIEVGDWASVAVHAEHHNRNWKYLKSRIETGDQVDAPIILRIGEKLYVVSGNTRLMITRALGKVPNVLIIDIS